MDVDPSVLCFILNPSLTLINMHCIFRDNKAKIKMNRFEGVFDLIYEHDFKIVDLFESFCLIRIFLKAFV